jgi:hypothetical protein
MNTTKWFTLGAAAALFSTTPAIAMEEHARGHEDPRAIVEQFFTPEYRSLYPEKMTQQPVADFADAVLARRDQFAAMTEDLARSETARVTAGEQGDAAVGHDCACSPRDPIRSPRR